jgi:hypothetical protein
MANRLGGMNMSTRKVLLSVVTTALFAVSGNASAEIYTPTSEAMADPTIGAAKNKQGAAAVIRDRLIVVPDNGDYASTLPATLMLPFHIETEVSKDKWRIKESYIVVGLAPINSGGQIGSCCGSLTEFDQYNYASRVPHSATKHVDIDGLWIVEVNGNSIATRARNACRDLRKKLSAQGMKHDDIFSQDRETTLPTPFRYAARVGHRNDNHDVVEAGTSSIHWKQSQESWANIKVTCQKAPSQVVGDPSSDPTSSGSGSLAAGFQVNQAALAITPNKYEAKCPAKLHLNPTIEATGKGTVKYRFVDQLGNKSQTFQVKFDKSDVKFLDHVIEIDGKGKPKGLGFAAAQAQSGGELGLAAPSDPNLTQGYFQVEVMAPHKKLSNIADYSVKCTVQTGGNDELAAVPDVVNPVIVDGLTLGYADLVIEQVQPSPAVPTKLFVKVINKGSAPSTPTNLKALHWIGSQSTARGTMVPALQPGQSEVILAELGGTIEEATQLYVRVDDPNRIKETNEGNNSFKVK